MGKLKGHIYPRQPYLHGEKLSLMPTKNLEVGFSRTVEWAGFGHPITFKSLTQDLSSASATTRILTSRVSYPGTGVVDST